MINLSHSKKLLSFVTAVCLVFGSAAAIPCSSYSSSSITASALETNGFTYDLNTDGTATITGCILKEKSITIPDTIDEKKVTAIGTEAFKYNTAIEKITVSYGITKIAESAFEQCTSLNQVLLPSSLESIGEKAFQGCSKLENVFFPNKLTSIGSAAFDGCRSLTQVSLTSVKSLGEKAFANCTGLWSAYIGSNITKLENSTFENCTSLTDVTLPEKLVSIGDNCFKGCENIKSIALPATVTTVNDFAFNNCAKLESVTHASAANLKFLGSDVFGSTRWLESQKENDPLITFCGFIVYGAEYDKPVLNIPANVKGIAGKAFAHNASIKALNIPLNVTFIGDNAFDDCQELTSAFVHKNISYIGKSIMSSCGKFTTFVVDPANALYSSANGAIYNKAKTKLLCCPFAKTSFTFEPTVSSIGESAFEGCSNLTAVKIPDTVTAIQKNAFADCTGLKDVTIPAKCKKIEDNAFCGCKNLSEATISDGVEQIGSSAFLNCALSSIVIPNTVESIGEAALGAYQTSKDKEPVYNKNFTVYAYAIQKVSQTYADDHSLNFVHTAREIRLWGSNRFDTSVEISRNSFPSADTVIIASGMSHADALIGVPIAEKNKAPILLSAKDYIPANTLKEIKSLGAKNAIILGGTSAVSQNAENTLTANGLKVRRIYGINRFATAANVANDLLGEDSSNVPESVFFVNYDKYPDALSVSSVAAIKGSPILYVRENGELDNSTKEYLEKIKGKVKNAYVIGGEMVISNEMADTISDTLGVTAKRVSGANRYTTCLAVNNEFKSLFDGSLVCLATGLNFPDALSGGVVSAKYHSPMLLADNNLSDEQKAFITKCYANQEKFSIVAFGGTNAVSEKLLQNACTQITVK